MPETPFTDLTGRDLRVGQTVVYPIFDDFGYDPHLAKAIVIRFTTKERTIVLGGSHYESSVEVEPVENNELRFTRWVRPADTVIVGDLEPDETDTRRAEPTPTCIHSESRARQARSNAAAIKRAAELISLLVVGTEGESAETIDDLATSAARGWLSGYAQQLVELAGTDESIPAQTHHEQVVPVDIGPEAADSLIHAARRIQVDLDLSDEAGGIDHADFLKEADEIHQVIEWLESVKAGSAPPTEATTRGGIAPHSVADSDSRRGRL